MDIYSFFYYILSMKLYTKRHIILAAAASAFLGLAIAGIFIFIYGIHCKSSAHGKTEAEYVMHNSFSENDTASSEQTDTLTDSFVLQTSEAAEKPVRNTSDKSTLYTQDELQNISVYERCNEAVVNINTQVMAVNWFLEPVPQNGGSGSGSIIDKRGYVVTNVHVIENAYKIYISLSDGTQYEGSVVGTDEASDIAVLKFEAPRGTELKTIGFGNSDSLKVGQKLIAIGNPFGLERTMTTGIVSGLGRPIQSSSGNIIRNMIQTDTAINPGNSGGPLLDTQGRMVGINNMIYSTSGSSAGIGFAVPVNTAKRVVADLIQYGAVRRGVLDPKAKLVQLNSSIASYAKLSVSSGLLVSELTQGGNAEKAGLRAGTEAVRYGSSRNAVIIYLGGDVITAIDGTAVSGYADYYSLLESKKPGDSVTLTVQRGKKSERITVVLSEAK